MMNRSESMAYPKTSGEVIAKINFLTKQHSKAFLATLCFLIFVVVVSLDQVQHYGGGSSGSSTNGGSGGGGLRAL
jgi:hypothetical protein